jgi:hypothetical protein
MPTVTAPDRPVDRLIRAAIWVVPVAAGLKPLGNAITLSNVGTGASPAAEARLLATPGYLVGQLVGSLAATVAGLFAALVLCGYLAATRYRRTVIAAAVLSIVGVGFTLPALGVITYAFPPLARAYLDGDHHAMNLVDATVGFPGGAMFYPGALVLVGAILLSVVMWRSGAVPRVATVLYLACGALISLPVVAHSLRLVGGMLGLGVGIWIALVVRERLARRAPPKTDTESSRA